LDEREFHAPVWKILGKPGAKWKQLEEYRDRFRPIYLKRLEELKAAAPLPAPDEDEEDAADRLDELRAEAVKAVDVRPCFDLSEIADLFDGKASPFMVTLLLWGEYAAATHWAKTRAEAMTLGRGMGNWGWRIHACKDDRCCPLCKRLDGTRFSFDDPLSLPFHIGCRCFTGEVKADEI
jgi:SPP1 gp7 family putative phage head morphogenesis protein